jgi:hypothetical protein
MSSKGKHRVVRQERLPHREAVQRLLRVYAKLCADRRLQLASGQMPRLVQEGKS